MTCNEWEQKYQSDEAHWDHGEPSPGLVEFLHEHPEIPRGTVAVPGCGFGHDVRAWAERGFRAYGYDVAPSAVRFARDRATSFGSTAKFVSADFLTHQPGERFDYLWEHTLFCALPPDSRARYVDAVARWLEPGGTYLAVNYIVCGPDGPPWPVSPRELWERFTPHFVLIDKWVPRSYPNRCGRELLSWWRRRT